MPFVANTPESLLSRSDSKNPSSTCRGITSNGRPCRRPVPAKPATSRPSTPDPRDESLYCWQHREQASMSAHSSPGPRATATPILEGRTSLDTLADRLGLVELQDKKKRRQRTDSAGRKTSKPKPKQTLSCCFCFSIPLEEVPETRPARPQPRPVQRTSIPVPPKRNSKQHLSASQDTSPGKSSRRSRKSTGSQTGQIKNFIPDSLDTTTASALMTELARPFVDSEEPGFIYMFWLTPTSDSTSPPVDAARSLLSPPSPSRPSRSRRPSDVVSSFAATDPSTARSTMLLKIGRASNVQRRLNQWQRQCGHEVEMLRYYPYLPGSQESSGVVPHMTTHVHRVERLVHIELAGMGLKANGGKCEACGREHREWFEVEATRKGIRAVDGVIRRWIEWDETNPSS